MKGSTIVQENNGIKLVKEVFQSDGGTNIIYDAEYLCEPCYMATHAKYEHAEIFDHKRRVLNTVIKKITNDGAYVCDHKKKCDMFKFQPKNGKAGISLRSAELQLERISENLLAKWLESLLLKLF